MNVARSSMYPAGNHIAMRLPVPVSTWPNATTGAEFRAFLPVKAHRMAIRMNGIDGTWHLSIFYRTADRTRHAHGSVRRRRRVARRASRELRRGYLKRGCQYGGANSRTSPYYWLGWRSGSILPSFHVAKPLLRPRTTTPKMLRNLSPSHRIRTTPRLLMVNSRTTCPRHHVTRPLMHSRRPTATIPGCPVNAWA